jgi:hypothetical protein
MDYETAKVIMIIFNMVMTLVLTISSFVGRRQRATVKSIKDLEDKVMTKLDEKALRIQKIEIDLQKMPSNEHLNKEREIASHEIIRIHERIDSLNTTAQQTQLLLGEVYGQLKQLNSSRNSHGQ